ncbi:hypothetical protein XocBAI20_11190 [Xanthomonas oryzae pv. oryzicola]|nr:hypothetical protein XocBAI20_11190 [Xanthomonas oryzae pv. oryzicola]
MICSSEKRFFTSNLLGVGNWTPNGGATQTWGDVALKLTEFSQILLLLRPAAAKMSAARTSLVWIQALS